MTTLDDLRLRVVPGDGVVLRAPGVTAVAFPSSDQHQVLVTAFLDAARAAAGQPDAGRKAARAVAGLLAAADDAPPLGLVGTDGAGLAVLLHADVEFAFRDAAGVDQTLSGRDAAAWLDRLLDTVPEQCHWPATGRVPPTSGPTSRLVWPGATDWPPALPRRHRSRRRTCRCRRSSPRRSKRLPPKSTWPLPRRRPRWPPR
ncbi:MAG: hypothetical protein ABWZ89_01255, partial [Acidimicrobiales bacterium]